MTDCSFVFLLSFVILGSPVRRMRMGSSSQLRSPPPARLSITTVSILRRLFTDDQLLLCAAQLRYSTETDGCKSVTAENCATGAGAAQAAGVASMA